LQQLLDVARLNDLTIFVVTVLKQIGGSCGHIAFGTINK